MKRPAFLLVALLAGALQAVGTGAAPAEARSQWVATWVAAQQLVEDHNLPPKPGLGGQTLRQLIQPSLGGDAIRVTFSNSFGEAPLTIAAANVARSKGGSAIDPDSACPLTFGGKRTVTIQPGASITSDRAGFKLRAFEGLAISASFTAMPDAITGHPGSRTTSFIQPGDAVSETEFPDATPVDHWYLLAAVDVLTTQPARAVLVLGDSITDGRGSTTNLNNRWPDDLARRLDANPRTRGIAVLNQGIGGNCVLRNGLGPPALQRFDRDVLGPPGVHWLIIFEGINDIGTTLGAKGHGEPASFVQELLAGYEQMIRRAHAGGLRVFGATIMPFAGFDAYYNAGSEEARQAINRWIRTSGKFDAVIDFDAITRDPRDQRRLSPAVDGGDHLHPSPEGHQVLAGGVALSLFDRDEVP